VVLANAYRTDSVLVRGSIITSINNVNAQTIIETCSDYISTDGVSNNFKHRLISNNFPYYYRQAFDTSKEYIINFIDTLGIARTSILKNYNRTQDTVLKKQIAQLPKTTIPKGVQKERARLAKRNLVIDTALSLGILTVNSFESGKQMSKFFRQSFAKIKELKLKHLAIDLRDNGGGSVSKSTMLSKFVINKPYKIADTVVLNNIKFPYEKYVHPNWPYKILALVGTKKLADGKKHLTSLERKLHKPYSQNHFDGNIFVITGGYSFSASILFISSLYGQQNVKLIGEETGGAQYGNSAINNPGIYLPNTYLRASLPLYRLVINKNITKTGHGYIPDILIPPGSIYLRKSIDPKLEYIRNWVKQNTGF
jgi:C-terminal processing protease CtpA/Prc